MMSDIYVLLMGRASELLLDGVSRTLHTLCKTDTISEHNTLSTLHYANVTRSSLTIFYEISKRIAGKIREKLSVDVSDNVYLRNMENNLYHMIKTLTVYNYVGPDDTARIESMKIALKSEYGNLIKPTDVNMSGVNLQLNFYAKSIDHLKDILNKLQVQLDYTRKPNEK